MATGSKVLQQNCAKKLGKRLNKTRRLDSNASDPVVAAKKDKVISIHCQAPESLS
jgi:hypothetical protein